MEQWYSCSLQGERECPFYMRTGSCKFATNCRFHHPDPTAVGESDPLPVYQNGTSVELNASTASSPIPPTWSLQINSNEPVPYMEASPPPCPPAIMVSPLRGVHPNPEWTRYMVSYAVIFTYYCQARTLSKAFITHLKMLHLHASRLFSFLYAMTSVSSSWDYVPILLPSFTK